MLLRTILASKALASKEFLIMNHENKGCILLSFSLAHVLTDITQEEGFKTHIASKAGGWGGLASLLGSSHVVRLYIQSM